MNYSQNNEQEVVLNHFSGHVGHLLDVGAYDGITWSNSRALIEQGWTGVLVEPDPRSIVKLLSNCRSVSDRVTIVGAAVSDHDYHLVPLRLDETPGREWASSIHVNNPGVLSQSKLIYQVPIIGIDTLLRLGGAGFDFITIDTEYTDFQILKAITLPMLGKCRMMCIEPTNMDQRAKMKPFLQALGLTAFYETPENLIAYKP